MTKEELIQMLQDEDVVRCLIDILNDATMSFYNYKLFSMRNYLDAKIARQADRMSRGHAESQKDGSESDT